MLHEFTRRGGRSGVGNLACRQLLQIIARLGAITSPSKPRTTSVRSYSNGFARAMLRPSRMSLDPVKGKEAVAPSCILSVSQARKFLKNTVGRNGP